MKAVSLRLGLGEVGHLVPAGALERVIGSARAREIVRETMRDPEGAAALRSMAEAKSFSVGLDDETVSECIAAMLEAGDLVLVRIAENDPYHIPGNAGEAAWAAATPLADLADEKPVRPSKAARSTTWLELQCVGDRGESYAGASVVVRDPEGGTRKVGLDDRSFFRIDDVPSSGTCWIELDLDARPNGVAPVFVGNVSDPSAHVRPGGTPVGLSTGKRHLVVVVQPRNACVKLVGMLFALNKSFLLSGALEGIRLLRHMYDAMPGSEILAIGHTDRTGKQYRNDSLSLERAEAVVAFMKDDVDGWLRFYDKAMGESRRWGWPEDLAMLSTLPRAATPYYSDEHEDHSFAAAVQRFQTEHALEVDGDCGPLTRAALVKEYMALDGTTLPGNVTAVAHGCGEHFPVVATEDDVEELQNRRVEVFFFRDGIEPTPSETISVAGSPEYGLWLESVEQERTFSPGLAGRGALRIETDVEFEWASVSDAVLVLRSVDGVYEGSRAFATDSVDSGGFAAFDFTDLLRASFYTLTVRYPDGREEVAFRDVPYPELARVGDDELMDPFTRRPPE